MQTHSSNSLIQFLLDCQALKFGDFTLKSGARSPFFIDLGNVRSGQQFETLGKFMADEICENFPDTSLIFGPAYKGITLAVAAATAIYRNTGRDIATFYDRKEAKAHGEGGSYIGTLPTSKDRILLIDDVLTSGLTKHQSIARLKSEFGVGDVDILVIVDRRSKAKAAEDDLKFRSLLNIHDLIAFLKDSGNEKAEIIQNWWETT